MTLDEVDKARRPRRRGRIGKRNQFLRFVSGLFGTGRPNADNHGRPCDERNEFTTISSFGPSFAQAFRSSDARTRFQRTC
jgi:hypothetical protein